MKGTRIKICGLTRPEDAAFCQAAGAQYLGVIFAPSPRRVTPARAASIRAAAPAVKLVGVFLDATMDEIVQTAGESGLDLLQLHGKETVPFCAEAAERTGLPVIKAITACTLFTNNEISACSGMDHLLLDLDKETRFSSSAIEELWRVAGRFGDEGRDIFLAGNLDPFNVAKAIEQCKPFGVDVCRGVEMEPGVKDLVAVERFIREVKNAL